jgi:hypothetical protein
MAESILVEADCWLAYAVLGEDTGIGVFCISVVKDKDK